MTKDYCSECERDANYRGCPVTPCGRRVKPYIATQNGVIKAVETWQMIVPLHDNNGKPFSKELIDTVRASVRKAFGGETYIKARGSWKQDQRIWIDKSIRIEVDVYTEDHDKAEAYMAGAKKLLRGILEQEKIYVTFSLSRFELLLLEEFLHDIGLKMPVPKDLSQIGVDLCRLLAATPK